MAYHDVVGCVMAGFPTVLVPVRSVEYSAGLLKMRCEKGVSIYGGSTHGVSRIYADQVSHGQRALETEVNEIHKVMASKKILPFQLQHVQGHR